MRDQFTPDTPEAAEALARPSLARAASRKGKSRRPRGRDESGRQVRPGITNVEVDGATQNVLRREVNEAYARHQAYNAAGPPKHLRVTVKKKRIRHLLQGRVSGPFVRFDGAMVMIGNGRMPADLDQRLNA